MNKTTNLCSQIRDGHKLFEDILWKNVCVACLFDVIRRHIDVICTQMEIGCWYGTDPPLSLGAESKPNGNFTFLWPCIVTNFFMSKPTTCTNFPNLFWHETLHVSDSSSVHHQEFIHCTLCNGICHTGL